MADVNKYEDVLDSRDIIDRIEELEEERTALVDTLSEASEVEAELNEKRSNDPDATELENLDSAKTEREDAARALEEWDSENGDELKALKALAEEAEGYGDWPYGETLIRDSYFKEYAQELAEETDSIPKGLTWPLTCIDWDQAARELQYDYTSVDFDGVTYWMRS